MRRIFPLNSQESHRQKLDPAGHLKSVSSSTDTFGYDEVGPVTSSANTVQPGAAWNPLYQYDDIGNRDGAITDLNGTVGYVPDLLNQYDAMDTTVPQYDADGNLTHQGNWVYTWNGENRLIAATDGVDTLSFAYDFQGRLISKTRNGVETLYLYDGWNRIASYQADGTLESTNLWGLDLASATLSNDGVSGSMQGAGGVGGLLREDDTYPLYDANGNIMQKLDATGATRMSVAYDPFGNIIDGMSSVVGDYAFSTKPMIEGLGMYDYGYRYYSPETGRWISRDPIQEEGGYNLYGFVGNDGVNAWDYLGMEWSDPDRNRDRNRAVVVGEVGDTIDELAEKIKLDPAEFEKWLRPVGDGDLPETSSEGISKTCEFTVPNMVVLTYGDMRPNPMDVSAGIVSNMNEMESDYTREGYKVRNYRPRNYVTGWNLDYIKRALSNEDLAIWGHGGHGHSSGGISVYDGTDYVTVTSSDIDLNYKLSRIIMYACHQGNPGNRNDWAQLVAHGGVVKAWPRLLSAGRWHGTRYEWLPEYTVSRPSH